jgi:D-amino-acid dehydrogenase
MAPFYAAVKGYEIDIALLGLRAVRHSGVGCWRPLEPRSPFIAGKCRCPDMTLPVGGWNNAPTVPIVDDHRKIAVARLGERIRLAGTAEFAGYDTTPNPRRAAMLIDAFTALFPNYPRSGQVQHWQGLRPMTPDGRPILGRTRFSNLYLNTGHRPLGWTLACGSAKALVDLMSDCRPEVDLSGFSVDRF